LGNSLAAEGKTADAITQYQHALQMDPRMADAHNNLGLALAAQGEYARAITHFEKAIALHPGHADAHNNLGLVFAAQGRLADATAQYQRALALSPDHALAHANLGGALSRQGKADEAIAHYRRALSLAPGMVTVQANLGVLLVDQGRSGEAMVHLECALALQPGNPDIHNNLGVALMAQGKLTEAIAHYQRALALNASHSNAHANLGTALAEQGRNAEALAHLETALALNPNHVEAHNTLGNLYKHQGQFGDALAHFDKAIALRPDYGQAYLNRSEIKSYRPGDPEVSAMETLAGGHGLSTPKAVNVHFALAKALEDCGEYARAFEHMHRGNTLKRGLVHYDEGDALEFFRRTAAAFDRGLIERLQGLGDPSAAPIFVMGMPRSGSSLIEQILASHRQVYGAGEFGDFEATVRSAMAYPGRATTLDEAMLRRIGAEYLAKLPGLPDGKTRIVDKLPGNYLYLGLIRLVLPNARIIHTVRNPIDTCVSCYSKLFTFGHHYTYDLRELGRFYRAYMELMAHWRAVLPADAMLDVSYEDVVDDLEGQARRLIEYCGLPWDDNCLNFHKNDRAVKTASSVQVRRPLFRTSMERWRRYQDGLGPLISELG
jgi:tetratricopeptide (TPR) repeat protein